MSASRPVCDSGEAHHHGCMQQHEAGLHGSVGIEQGGAPGAQSIKKEPFALWE